MESVAAQDLLEELKRKRILVPASRMLQSATLVTSGIAGLDRVCGGGLPRGSIVELLVPSCGAGTVLYALLSAASSRGESAALVDPADGFDVDSAHAAGADLERLLWVRARGEKEALRAAELILDAGGFGLLVLDMGMLRRRISVLPAAVWMRLKRLCAISDTLVAVLSRTGDVGTFASLSVRVRRDRIRFGGRHTGERWFAGVDLSFELHRKRMA